MNNGHPSPIAPETTVAGVSPVRRPATFPKRERLVSRKLMETLFNGGSSRSFSAFPLRVIYTEMERTQSETVDQAATGAVNKVTADSAPVQVLVSVSKRHFKHAVDRNRVKRQIREAYRKHKHLLSAAVPADRQLLLAFVWLSDRHMATADVEKRVKNLLQRMSEKR